MDDWTPEEVVTRLAEWWPDEQWATIAPGYVSALHLAGAPRSAVMAGLADVVRTGRQRVPSPSVVLAAVEARLRSEQREQRARAQDTPDLPSWWPIIGEACPACGAGLVLTSWPPMMVCPTCNSVLVQDAATGRVVLTPEERREIKTGPVRAWNDRQAGAARRAEVIQSTTGERPDLSGLWTEAARREAAGERVDWPLLRGPDARFRSVARWLAWRDRGAPLPEPILPTLDTMRYPG